jgi:hypothetical protein
MLGIILLVLTQDALADVKMSEPKAPRGHDEYELEILAKYPPYFGPYPPSYVDLTDQETLRVLSLVMNDVPPGEIEAFLAGWTTRDFKEDKEFVLEITKLDPRNRSASQELLDGKWFDDI